MRDCFSIFAKRNCSTCAMLQYLCEALRTTTARPSRGGPRSSLASSVQISISLPKGLRGPGLPPPMESAGPRFFASKAVDFVRKTLEDARETQPAASARFRRAGRPSDGPERVNSCRFLTGIGAERDHRRRARRGRSRSVRAPHLEVPVARDPPAIVPRLRATDDRRVFARARPSRSNPARARPDFNNEESNPISPRECAEPLEQTFN